MTDKAVVVPDLGGADSVDVIEVCVKVGDRVATEDSLIVVESDKATIEVPAPFGGEVAKLAISVGDSIKEGDLILSLTTDDAGNAGAGISGADISAVDNAESTQAEVIPVTENNAETTTSDASQEKGSEPDQEEKSYLKTIVVPDIGGGDAVEIIEINVAVGDVLAQEDTMMV